MNILVDYASIDGNLPPDFGAFRRACQAVGSTARAVYMRGAYGTWPDPTVDRDWKAAQAAGLMTGAYLLLRMRADQPPEDQVSAFAKNVGALTERDLVPAIDIEDTGFTAQGELDYVHRAWSAMLAIYRVPPVIYDSARVWHEDLHDLPAGEMTSSPLWLAKPWPWPIHSAAQLAGSAAFGSGKYDPTVPGPWGPGNWWWHQYQGDALAAGFSRTVDLSRFHTMVMGEIGPRVRWVQDRMQVPRTGRFDSAMAAQVRAFQRAHSLEPDAIVGVQTYNALSWSYGPPALRCAA